MTVNINGFYIKPINHTFDLLTIKPHSLRNNLPDILVDGHREKYNYDNQKHNSPRAKEDDGR